MSDAPSAVEYLDAALTAVAPGADQAVWIGALTPALAAWDITSARRVAAFLGQCVAEAGSSFAELEEDLFYTHTDRLVAIWPSRFADEGAAAPYLRNPEALANRVYAGKLGNGDEASGDGWLFRGGGLLQLTGREEYAAYAAARGLAIEGAAAQVRTPAGAADSAAWYWQTNGCNALADGWRLSAITRAVNGSAMLAGDLRATASNQALAALNAAMGVSA